MESLEHSNSWWCKLPLDIQADILIRLPGNTLITLKLVSCQWFHVISHICIPKLSPPSPYASFAGFIYLQRNLLKPTLPPIFGLATLSDQSKFKISAAAMDRLSQDDQVEDVRDCCNGLLLKVHCHHDGSVRYSVYNPTTGERIQVPSPPSDYHSHSNTVGCCFASLLFDPTDSLCYKIISTPGGIITNPLKVEAFSSETGKWSRYVVSIDSKIDGVEWIRLSVYLDGRVYRLLKANYLVCMDQEKSVQAIELPKFGGGIILSDGNNYHGSIGGHLHYSTRDRNGSTLLVYTLMDDVGWLLKHNISVEVMLTNQSSHFLKIYSTTLNKYSQKEWFNFCFHPNCDRLYLITPCMLLVYSPEEKLLKGFHSKGGGREIIMDQNCSFPYSYCPVILQSALQRTSRSACWRFLPNWKGGSLERLSFMGLTVTLGILPSLVQLDKGLYFHDGWERFSTDMMVI